MYGILLSALNSSFGLFVRSGLVKFAVLFAIYFVIAEFAITLASYANSSTLNANSLSSALGTVPSSIWYFLDLFSFTQGISIVLTAHVYRFLIRRIPLIG